MYKRLKEEKENAEYRAMEYMRKLANIEQVLRYAEETKEPSVFTVNKVKEVIHSQN